MFSAYIFLRDAVLGWILFLVALLWLGSYLNSMFKILNSIMYSLINTWISLRNYDLISKKEFITLKILQFRNFRELGTVKLLIPEINELLQDEEVQVRNTAITVLIDICPHLSKGQSLNIENYLINVSFKW